MYMCVCIELSIARVSRPIGKLSSRRSKAGPACLYTCTRHAVGDADIDPRYSGDFILQVVGGERPSLARTDSPAGPAAAGLMRKVPARLNKIRRRQVDRPSPDPEKTKEQFQTWVNRECRSAYSCSSVTPGERVSTRQ